MKYEKPDMEILVLKGDVITLSSGSPSQGPGTEFPGNTGRFAQEFGGDF